MRQTIPQQDPKRARDRRRGQSVVETALMMPWILILFSAILNFGFYFYAVIATQNAARVAALAVSSSESVSENAQHACRHVANEMLALPNIGAYSGNCTAAPLIVSAAPVPANSSVDGEPAARVRVTYRSIPLFPIPGIMNELNVTREVEMRVRP